MSTVKSVAAAIPKVNFHNLFRDTNPESTSNSKYVTTPPLASPEVKSFMKRSMKREQAADLIVEGDNSSVNDHNLPILKLVYFDLRGNGEPIRLALTYCNIPFRNFTLYRTTVTNTSA